MILSPVIFIFLAASFGSVVVSFQNGDAASNGVHQVRALAEKEFYQLDCNSKFSTCLTWTSQYGTRKTYSKRVLVKCGECIQMDHPGPELILSDGIDIRGKLVFPDGYKLTVNSTMIVVQGELVMEASKPVDGDPSIKFVMTGEVDQTFTPIGQNSQACGGNVCNVGKKSITVAGGKIRIYGLPRDTPTWTRLYDVSDDSSTIVVDSSVRNKWSAGAEILLTSFTRDWNMHQVRRIEQVSNYKGRGHVKLKLDMPIEKPTTLLDSADFAVEVALLSRNIVFEGGPDSNANHGGHLWVLHTPNVQQVIEGVEVVNFGQQGIMGRYPIHFHFCDSVEGSVVAKNSIRSSNQRCIVIHGTNKLRVEENIAFDTMGHCFMTEDGIETENRFIRNLGAFTRKPLVSIPDMGANGIETDIDNPSTFWITNSNNNFTGNVAAGSEGSGYWFELLVRGFNAQFFSHIEPKRMPLGEFIDNVAHSNFDKGLRTYRSGYQPVEEALFINFRAYLNSGGVFFHRTRNVALIGGVFSDNEISIDIDRAEDIRVVGAVVIGQSESFRSYLESKNLNRLICSQPHIGIDIHTWKDGQGKADISLILENINFSGFRHIPCDTAFPFSMDRRVMYGTFNMYTTMKNVTVETGVDFANLCNAEAAKVVDIYLTDLDGSLGRTAQITSKSAPSVILSNHPNMLKFVDLNKCVSGKERCFSYCEDICFQTVLYEINPAESQPFILKLCKKGNPTNCNFVNGSQTKGDPKDSTDLRVFVSHIPFGEYESSFINQRGDIVWPSFVNVYYEDSPCPTKYGVDAVSLLVPPINFNSRNRFDNCNHLVRNGDFESSKTEPTNWLYLRGGITMDSTGGVAGSLAASANETLAVATLLQFIDSRCLEAFIGEYYQFEAYIKLTKNNGSVFECDTNERRCPEIGIYSTGLGFILAANVDAQSSVDGFQKANGYLKITESIAQSSGVSFYARSNVADHVMSIDNISMQLVKNKSQFCKNLIQESKFDGITWQKLWKTNPPGNGNFSSTKPGFNSPTAMRYSGRRSNLDGPMYVGLRNIELDCLTPGSAWMISAQVKLVDHVNGTGASCNPGQNNDCPSIRLLIQDGLGSEVFNMRFLSYPKVWKSDSFNKLQQVFSLPDESEWDGSIGTVMIDFRNFPSQNDIIVDNFMWTSAS